MKSCTLSSWLVGTILVAGVPLSATTPSWESLVGNSPFGAAPAGAVPGVAGAPEFRGYFSEKGEQFFSIYDPARGRSFWMRPGETSGTLTARHFDAAAQVLKVELEGRALSLPLKRATVQAAPAALAAVKAPASAAPALGAEEAVSPEIRQAEQNLARARQRLELEKRRKLAAEKAEQGKALAAKRRAAAGS